MKSFANKFNVGSSLSATHHSQKEKFNSSPTINMKSLILISLIALVVLSTILSENCAEGQVKKRKKKKKSKVPAKVEVDPLPDVVEVETTTLAPLKDCTGVKCHNPPHSDTHCESKFLSPRSCCPLWTCTMHDNSHVQVMGEFRQGSGFPQPQPFQPVQPPQPVFMRPPPMMGQPGMGMGPPGMGLPGMGPPGMGPPGMGPPGMGMQQRPMPIQMAQPVQPVQAAPAIARHPGNPGGYNFTDSYSKSFSYALTS